MALGPIVFHSASALLFLVADFPLFWCVQRVADGGWRARVGGGPCGYRESAARLCPHMDLGDACVVAQWCRLADIARPEEDTVPLPP
jgi:hypothetical protein